MNAEMNSSPQGETKPPARPVYRKMAWVMAAVGYVMAVVAGLGLPDKEGRLSGVVMFLFFGYVFTTIAMTGYWPLRKPVVPRSEPSTRNYIFLAFICRVFCVTAADELRFAAAHGVMHRLMNLITLFFGSIGFVSSLWVLWRGRRKTQ